MSLSVLAFTPVYRLEPETVKALFALEWEGSLSFLLQRDPTGRPDGVDNHYHQYARGRETFLGGPWDALLVVESDIIPPPDALQRLAALDCDVAYGVYVFRGAGPVVNVFERYREKGGVPALNTGESLTVRGLWDEAKAAGVVACSGGGLGIILIKRHVLEAVPFALPADRRGGKNFCDSDWTYAVYQKGYTMKADCGVLCGHKDTDGTVLWPQ